MSLFQVLRGLRIWLGFARLHWNGRLLSAKALLRGSFVDYGCRFANDGVLELGTGVVIQRHAMIGIGEGGVLTIGDHSRIGSDAVISCGQRVRIGKSVLIAARCFIGDYGHAFTDAALPVMEQGGEEKRPVVIGDGSWLGINVCILPGVALGRNCVVAANSVVRVSFPDGSVVAGVPARLIRSLSGG